MTNAENGLMPGKAPEPYEGLWWRFNAYEIRDNMISPAPGAHLEIYRPWSKYRESVDAVVELVPRAIEDDCSP